MTETQKAGRFPVGSVVRVLRSGFHRARVAEDRGFLGPQGARVYGIVVEDRPKLYIEVLEDQLEAVDENPTRK
jgi:hypothetical protein